LLYPNALAALVKKMKSMNMNRRMDWSLNRAILEDATIALSGQAPASGQTFANGNSRPCDIFDYDRSRKCHRGKGSG